MPPKSNLLKPELRVAYISGKLFFATIIIVAIISGGSVYLSQKEIVRQAIQEKQEKQLLTDEVLRLREQIAANGQISKGNRPDSDADNQYGNSTSTRPVDENFSFGYTFHAPTSTDAFPYFISVDDKESFVAFDKKIYASLKKNGEKISGVYCPENPYNLDIIFFSTFKKTPSPANTIYSYNITTKDIKSIFNNSGGIIKILGISGNKLIAASLKNETTLGKCMSIFAGHEETSYYYLDINNAKNGLKPYNLPQEQIERGRAEEQDCLGKK